MLGPELLRKNDSLPFLKDAVEQHFSLFPDVVLQMCSELAEPLLLLPNAPTPVKIFFNESNNAWRIIVGLNAVIDC